MNIPPSPVIPPATSGHPAQFQHSDMVADHQQKEVLGPEEKRILDKCMSQAFWTRSMPLSAFSTVAIHMAIKRGILKASPKYGSTPKVFAGCVVSYFLGKFSYINTCTQMILLQAPDSALAERIRTQKGIPSQQQSSTPGLESNSGRPAVLYSNDPGMQQLKEQQAAGFNQPNIKGESGGQGSEEPLSGYDQLRLSNRGKGTIGTSPTQEQQQFLPLLTGPPPEPVPAPGGAPLPPPVRPRGGPAAAATPSKNKYGDEGFSHE